MTRIFVPTQSPQDWQPLLAKPQVHWKKGASAMTLAACWESANGRLPPELEGAFSTSGIPDLLQLEILFALPEYEVPLPGGTTASQTDLLVVARNETGLAVIAVEGKVEEPAGPTLGEKRSNASAGLDERLKDLHETLEVKDPLGDAIRYQLVHRTASAIKTAKQFHARTALMVVHSFSPRSTGYEDFEAFCKKMGVVGTAKNVPLQCPNVTSLNLFLVWCPGDPKFREKDYLQQGAKINLFSGTRKLTNAKENHLTEFFAAALVQSRSFRDSYCEATLSRHASRNGWSAPEIIGIETQVSFDEGSACPDLVLRLADGRTIAVEHKIEAAETTSPDSDRPDQLLRYLQSKDIDALIYVRESHVSLGSDILSHAKYVVPSEGGVHFVWRDFYPYLEREGGWYFHWLCSAFDSLGYRPAHPKLGDWNNSDDRKNFAKLWDSTKRIAESTYGWKISTGSVVELYLANGQSPLAESIWIDPEEFASLRLRITPKAARLPDLLAALEPLRSTSKVPVSVEAHQVRRSGGTAHVVDVTASLLKILPGNVRSAKDIDTQLAGHVEKFLRVLSNAKARPPSSGENLG